MRFWKGYKHGYDDGRVQALQEFERILAVLREELADSRADAAKQSHRADAACDLLLGHLGARAISLAGETRETERADRHVNAVKQLASLPDPTEELPIGHPFGLYQSEADARIDAGEDAAGFAVTEG